MTSRGPRRWLLDQIPRYAFTERHVYILCDIDSHVISISIIDQLSSQRCIPGTSQLRDSRDSTAMATQHRTPAMISPDFDPRNTDTHYLKRRDSAHEIIEQQNTQPPRRLLTWEETPSWQHDNEFVLSGYRCGIVSTFRPSR
jgi:hypothetical protein